MYPTGLDYRTLNPNEVLYYTPNQYSTTPFSFNRQSIIDAGIPDNMVVSLPVSEFDKYTYPPISGVIQNVPQDMQLYFPTYAFPVYGQINPATKQWFYWSFSPKPFEEETPVWSKTNFNQLNDLYEHFYNVSLKEAFPRLAGNEDVYYVGIMPELPIENADEFSPLLVGAYAKLASLPFVTGGRALAHVARRALGPQNVQRLATKFPRLTSFAKNMLTVPDYEPYLMSGTLPFTNKYTMTRQALDPLINRAGNWVRRSVVK